MQRQALLENDIETVYVSEKQISEYWRYIEENIRQIIGDREVELADRSAILYHSSYELTRQILEVPARDIGVRRADTLVCEAMRLHDEGKQALHSIMTQMESHPDVYSSALNVCHYGIALAHRLGIGSAQNLQDLGLGLLFQDLGLLSLPEELLHKTPPFSFEEWDMIKRHPALGLEALSHVNGLSDLARSVVFGHHERIDGSGYPQGVSAAEIPVHLRIAGVVDTFNTLTVSVPNRKALTSLEALTLLSTEMKSAFDQKIVASFVELLGV
jgi:HD-GYP domain-containing protein (c-di-GMP phosphodiesterase class II)